MVATLSALATGSPELAGEIATVVERLRRSVVTVRDGRRGSGSGVIWAQHGVIVTNFHVTPGTDAQVELRDGRSFSAKVRLRDPEHDLAVLDVPAHSLPAVRAGDSDRLRVGEIVFAVGNPLGLSAAVNTGIITATPRTRGMGPDGHGMVQADVSLAPGNSGGLLATADGAVVGINSMVRGPGLALAVPSNRVTELLGAQSGERGYLGIALFETALPTAWASPAVERPGYLVTSVEPRSPAASAGVILGDVIVAMNGQVLDSFDRIDRILAATSAGAAVRITLLRGGVSSDVTVQAGSPLDKAA